MPRMTHKQLMDENAALRNENATLRTLLQQERSKHNNVADVATVMVAEARRQAMTTAKQLALRFGQVVKV